MGPTGFTGATGTVPSGSVQTVEFLASLTGSYYAGSSAISVPASEYPFLLGVEEGTGTTPPLLTLNSLFLTKDVSDNWSVTLSAVYIDPDNPNPYGSEIKYKVHYYTTRYG
jgi:hypothetical protein